MFKLSRISRTELFAARSADFAVDFHGTLLHQFLGKSAGIAKSCEFQQGIQLNEFRVNGYRNMFLIFSHIYLLHAASRC